MCPEGLPQVFVNSFIGCSLIMLESIMNMNMHWAIDELKVYMFYEAAHISDLIIIQLFFYIMQTILILHRV